MQLFRLLVSVLLVLVGLASQSHAWEAEKWTKTNIALGTAATVVHMLDWGTTLDIADKPTMYHEKAPFARAVIGEHPSRGDVNLFMASLLVAKLGIAHALPSKWRNYFFGATIAVQGYWVVNNFRIGLRLNF